MVSLHWNEIEEILQKRFTGDDDIKRLVEDICNIVDVIEKDVKEGVHLVDIYEIFKDIADVIRNVMVLSKESEYEIIKDIVYYIVEIVLNGAFNKANSSK